MRQHAIADEVGLKVLDFEVVDEDRRGELLQRQARDHARIAGKRMDAVPKRQVTSRNPALAHHVEWMVRRRVDVTSARLDVQKLAVLPDEDLFDFLQRRLSGLDVAGPDPVPDLYLIDAPEAGLRRDQRVISYSFQCAAYAPIYLAFCVVEAYSHLYTDSKIATAWEDQARPRQHKSG